MLTFAECDRLHSLERWSLDAKVLYEAEQALMLAVMTHHQRAVAFIGILGERAFYAFNCNHLSVGSVSIIVHLEEPCSGIGRKGHLPLFTSIIGIIIRWDKGRRFHTLA